MAKKKTRQVKIYTYEELNDIEDAATLYKILNTQAERFNKQITRGIKAGIDYTATHGVKKPKRFNVFKKPDLNVSDLQGLRNLYRQRQRMSLGGYSQGDIKRIMQMQKRYQEDYYDTDEPLTYEQTLEAYDTEQYVNSKSAIYYEMMRIGVTTEVYEDYQVASRPDLPEPTKKSDVLHEIQRLRREYIAGKRAAGYKGTDNELDDELPATMEEIKNRARETFLSTINPRRNKTVKA